MPSPAHLPVQDRDLILIAGAEEHVVQSEIAVAECLGGSADIGDMVGDPGPVRLGQPAHLGREEAAEMFERGAEERQVDALYHRPASGSAGVVEAGQGRSPDLVPVVSVQPGNGPDGATGLGRGGATELVARLQVAEILEHQDEAVAAIFILAVQQAR